MERVKIEKQLVENLIDEYDQIMYANSCAHGIGTYGTFSQEEREKLLKMTLEQARKYIETEILSQ